MKVQFQKYKYSVSTIFALFVKSNFPYDSINYILEASIYINSFLALVLFQPNFHFQAKTLFGTTLQFKIQGY